MLILAVGAQSRSCLRLPSASCRKLNTLLKATVMLLWASTTPVGGKLRLGFEWHRFLGGWSVFKQVELKCG